MLVIFNHRPIMTLLTSPDHVTVGSGTPIVLQYKDTLPPSTTDILVIGCTDAGTEEQKLPNWKIIHWNNINEKIVNSKKDWK